MRRLCDKPRIGANGRFGFGRFAYQLIVYGNDGSVIGELNGGPTTHPPIESLTDPLRERLNAAQEAIDRITTAELHALSLPSATSIAEVRGKIKGADAAQAYDRLYAGGGAQ
jgi:hypothetical protein